MDRGHPFYPIGSKGPIERGELVFETDCLALYRYCVGRRFALNGRERRCGADEQIVLFIGFSRPNHRIVALFLCTEPAFPQGTRSRFEASAHVPGRPSQPRPAFDYEFDSRQARSFFDAPKESDVLRWLATLGKSGTNGRIN